jgi:release factor glutamine methyltransferase
MAPHVLDFEPHSALFVKDDEPLIFYHAIAGFCKKYLAEKGELWVEINENFGKETALLFETEGFSKVQLIRDIHDKERYINACK